MSSAFNRNDENPNPEGIVINQPKNQSNARHHGDVRQQQQIDALPPPPAYNPAVLPIKLQNEVFHDEEEEKKEKEENPLYPPLYQPLDYDAKEKDAAVHSQHQQQQQQPPAYHTVFPMGAQNQNSALDSYVYESKSERERKIKKTQSKKVFGGDGYNKRPADTMDEWYRRRSSNRSVIDPRYQASRLTKKQQQQLITRLDSSPGRAICPYCSAEVITVTHKRKGGMFWLCVGFIGCLSSCWLFWLPFCTTAFHDTTHDCPACHHRIKVASALS